MKKLLIFASIFLALSTACSPPVHAQSVQPVKSSATPDTIIHVDTAYYYVTAPLYGNLSFEIVATPVTGTFKADVYLEYAISDVFPALSTEWLPVKVSGTAVSDSLYTSQRALILSTTTGGANQFRLRLKSRGDTTQKFVPKVKSFLRPL